MFKPILGYWDLRGRAAPIRYLLHYKNIDFEDKRYPLDNFDNWFKEKFKLGLDFPNLPYYMDGELKLSQSVAILRHLARKHDLEGKTEQQRLRVALAEQQLSQLRENLRNLCYNDEFDKLRPGFVSNLQGDLELFDAYLGDLKFIAGDDEVTYVDFMAYELFDLYCYLVEDVFKDFPRLASFYKRVRSLPSLEKYLKSPSYRRWPIFAPFASFGGKGPEPKRE